jgi:hypothetical protein
VRTWSDGSAIASGKAGPRRRGPLGVIVRGLLRRRVASTVPGSPTPYRQRARGRGPHPGSVSQAAGALGRARSRNRPPRRSVSNGSEHLPQPLPSIKARGQARPRAGAGGNRSLRGGRRTRECGASPARAHPAPTSRNRADRLRFSLTTPPWTTYPRLSPVSPVTHPGVSGTSLRAASPGGCQSARSIQSS